LNNSNHKSSPLEGIKVVEYGVFHAGPGAGAILGDLGAEVIKIECGIGDPERYWTSVGRMSMAGPDGESIMHEISNRNKKGVYLDIKTEKGRAIFLHMIKDADVFITNLRKSTKKRLAIDYDTLSRENPRLIHANVSGYGQEGPVCDLGAFDPLGQARSGMMFLSDPERPGLIHLAVLDQATAIAASHAILTALYVRERKQKGQEVHVSLYGTGMWLLYANLMIQSLISVDSAIPWHREENSPLRNSFCCADGKWVIGVHHPEEKYWPSFCKATGREDMIGDHRFADNDSRAANRKELLDIFDNIFAQKSRDEWMERFAAYGLMFSPVQRIAEVLTDRQALENGYVVPFKHPTFGNVKIPGYPVHFSDCQAGTRSAAPKIGQHTESVLQGMGFTLEEIERLKEEKVIR